VDTLRQNAHHSALKGMQRRGLWNGSFNGKECTIQQLSPYIGKLKSGMVRSLVTHFTKPGEWVCDPFAGSGIVPLEALLLGRKALANDLSEYAFQLMKGKLSAPASLLEAQQRVTRMTSVVRRTWANYDLRKVPPWVRCFYHPRTLKEILAAFHYCRTRDDAFLASCLCGILHHQRPGFLSFPSSHMVPYLRTSLFPREKFPELYGYRDLESRIRAKVNRAYRRPPNSYWSDQGYKVTHRDARQLPFRTGEADLILSSPPYYGALDYARDNRLRLWFLGEPDWRTLNGRLMSREGTYEQQMARCLSEMYRVLKVQRFCVLVVGEVQHNGKTRDTGAVLGRLATEVTDGAFRVDCVIEDEIPDIRRSRRGTKTTKLEKILVLRKSR
jgi:DNA modification methylase